MSTDLLLLLGAALLVLVAATLAGIDSALTRVSRVAVEEFVREGRPHAEQLSTIVADAPRYLNLLLLLRKASELGATCLVALVAVRAVGPDLGAVALATLAMTLVSYIVIGVAFRTLGRQHANEVALRTAAVTAGLARVFGPVPRLLIVLGNAITPGRGYRDGPFATEAELRDLVDLAEERGLVEPRERDMIASVFELGDTLAREVMVPRTDMVSIDDDRVCRQAMTLFLRSGFSRIPVLGRDVDDVVGLLYLKDVIRRTNADPKAGSVPVTEVMRPMPFVPESKPVDDLLREMQLDQTHFAVVVDEYGGTAGLVTIEDILEEIVGEITDEYDREAPEVEDLGDGRVRVAATMHVDDLAELFDVDLDEDAVDTVGGLIGKTIGRVPILGSTCEVAGLRLTAERMSGRRHRIATVIVERVEPVTVEPAEVEERVG